MKSILSFRMSKGRGKKSKPQVNGTETVKKKSKFGQHFQMSPRLQNPDLKRDFKEAWSSSSDEDTVRDDVTLIKSPFSCCVVKNLRSRTAP